MSDLIQGYLNDTSIDVNKRRSVQEQLKNGFDVGKMEKLLSSKYGNTYGANPIQQSSSDTRSVAEKEGWGGGVLGAVGALGSVVGKVAAQLPTAMKQYADQTGLSDKKPGELWTKPIESKTVYQTPETVGSDLKSNPEFSQAWDKMTNNQKMEVDKAIKSGANPDQILAGVTKNLNLDAKNHMSIPERLQNTALKTVDAVKAGQEQVGVGVEEIKGANTRKEIAQNVLNSAKEKLASGKISQDVHDQLVAKAHEIAQEAGGTANVGLSNVFGGATRTVFSPAEGAVTGGFEPEMNKLAKYASEKIGDSEKASEFVSKLSKLAEEHPAMKNYLMAGLDIAGVHGGTKVVKGVGEGTLNAVKKAGTSPTVQNTIQNLATTGKNMGAKLYDKFDSAVGKDMVPEKFVMPVKPVVEPKIVTPRGIKKKSEKILALVKPELGKKEVQQALLDQRLTRGKQSMWTGRAPDTITQTNTLKKASETVAANLKGAHKLNDVNLHAKLGDEISKLSTELKPQLEQVKLRPEVIEKGLETWAKTKKIQAEDPILQSFPGLATAQKNFQNVLNALTNGKPKNLNDLWKIKRQYDKTVKASIKDAAEVNSEAAQLYQKVWLQNREILNDLLKAEAENAGVGIKDSFSKMSDYYTVQNEIFRLVKGVKKTPGILSKETLKKAAIGAIGTKISYDALTGN